MRMFVCRRVSRSRYSGSNMTDFAAIDFETANECPSSVCSVGVVVVRDGKVVDTFYSLIHPEPEYYQWFCMRVHEGGVQGVPDGLSGV